MILSKAVQCSAISEDLIKFRKKSDSVHNGKPFQKYHSLYGTWVPCVARRRTDWKDAKPPLQSMDECIRNLGINIYYYFTEY